LCKIPIWGYLVRMSTDVDATMLAEALERLSEISIEQLIEILRLPIDLENGHLLRAKTTAAMVGLNTQLRADHLRLRAAREDKALERLIALMQEKQLSVPIVAVARETSPTA